MVQSDQITSRFSYFQDVSHRQINSVHISSRTADNPNPRKGDRYIGNKLLIQNAFDSTRCEIGLKIQRRSRPTILNPGNPDKVL